MENIASRSFSLRFSGRCSPNIFRALLPEHKKYPTLPETTPWEGISFSLL